MSIGFIFVQPLSTNEDGGHPVGGVGDLHALQEPAGRRAGVVVLHSDPQEFPQIQHLQQESVRLSAFKQVPELLLERSLPWVSVDAVERDEDVGVGGGFLHVSGDDDYFVFDGNQTADFAGETLHGFGALERHELVFLGRQRNPCVTREVEPAEEEQGEWRSDLLSISDERGDVNSLVSQLFLRDHHLLHVPERLVLDFFLLRYMAQTDTDDLSHIFRGKLEWIRGTTGTESDYDALVIY